MSIGANTQVLNSVISNSIIGEHTVIRNKIFEKSMIGSQVLMEGNTEQLSTGDFSQSQAG